MAPTKSLQATIFGVDKASPVFDKVGRSATQMASDTETSSRRMGEGFSKGAKMAAGALAAIGFTDFVKDSVKAFTEAQAQTQKLVDAYEKFPAMRDVTVQSFQDISSELMNVTKFDDDATNAAAGLLGQLSLTGMQIQTLLPLLQDYATATHKDLNTATTDLGKALLGQTRALKEVGINYKSTGDKATDFTNITALLREKVGGFAENEGKTAEGQLEILKNQFGEVQEKIGSALVPALTSAGKIAIPVLEGIGTASNLLVTAVEEIPGPVKIALTALLGFKLLQQSRVFESLASSARGFREEMALQTSLAAASGQEISRMEAAAAVAQTRTGGLASTVGKVGAYAVATAAVAGLVKAWNDYHKILLDTGTLIDQTNGKLADTAKTDIAKSLGPHLAVIERAGLTVPQVVDAIVAGGDQLDGVVTKLDNAGGVAKGIVDDLGHAATAGFWASDADHAAEEVNALGNALANTRTEQENAARAAAEMASQSVVAAQATRDFIGPTLAEADAAAQAVEARRRHYDALVDADAILGSAATAMGQWIRAQQQGAAAARDLTAAQDETNVAYNRSVVDLVGAQQDAAERRGRVGLAEVARAPRVFQRTALGVDLRGGDVRRIARGVLVGPHDVSFALNTHSGVSCPFGFNACLTI